jgi:hypothetical protein
LNIHLCLPQVPQSDTSGRAILSATIGKLEKDLAYTLHFPKGEEYISLFPKKAHDEKTLAKIEKLRKLAVAESVMSVEIQKKKQAKVLQLQEEDLSIEYDPAYQRAYDEAIEELERIKAASGPAMSSDVSYWEEKDSDGIDSDDGGSNSDGSFDSADYDDGGGVREIDSSEDENDGYSDSVDDSGEDEVDHSDSEEEEGEEIQQCKYGEKCRYKDSTCKFAHGGGSTKATVRGGNNNDDSDSTDGDDSGSNGESGSDSEVASEGEGGDVNVDEAMDDGDDEVEEEYQAAMKIALDEIAKLAAKTNTPNLTRKGVMESPSSEVNASSSSNVTSPVVGSTTIISPIPPSSGGNSVPNTGSSRKRKLLPSAESDLLTNKSTLYSVSDKGVPSKLKRKN